jgi:hypothetical protein
MRMTFLPLALLLVATPVGFSQITSGHWTYSLNASNEVTITGYNGPGGAVRIPAVLDGYRVKRVGASSSIFGRFNAAIHTVVLPSGLTHIGNNAFFTCTGLNTVVIPETVVSIEAGAFSLTGLTQITIPDGVTTIGGSAFSYCQNLSSVTIPKSVTSIESGAFSFCTGLGSVTVGDGVTSIGSSAFFACTSLSRISIGSSVETIESHAFQSSNLQHITFRGNVPRYAGDSIFGNIFAVGKIHYLVGSKGWGSNFAGWPIQRTSKIKQFIRFAPAQTLEFQKNKSFTLTATASSGLEVTFKSSNPKVLSIHGRTATMKRKGSVVVTANQDGEHRHLPALAVRRRINVQ